MFFHNPDFYNKFIHQSAKNNILVTNMSATNVCECPSWTMMTLSAYFASSAEVWLRAFALGFGAHMLALLFWEKRDADFEDIKKRTPVSLVSGVAVACFVFGSSFFLPAQFRINWFDYE